MPRPDAGALTAGCGGAHGAVAGPSDATIGLRRLGKAMRDRDALDVLFDGEVLYYEADPRRSVWSAAGYGRFGEELVHRVLCGDLTARARNHPDRSFVQASRSYQLIT